MEDDQLKQKPAQEGETKKFFDAAKKALDNTDEYTGEKAGMQVPPGSELKTAAINKMQEAAQTNLKEMRVKVDSFYLTAKECLPSGRYAALAVTKYQSSRQMLGIVLGEKGAAYPYQSLADQTNKVSGQRADKGSVIPEVEALKDDVVLCCKKLRELTEDVITDMIVFLENPDNTPTGIKDAICSGQALSDLISAKMQVGEILGEIAEKAQ